MEFSDQPIGGSASGGEVSGDIGGEIFIPLDSDGSYDHGTLDEPVFTTLVSNKQDYLWAPPLFLRGGAYVYSLIQQLFLTTSPAHICHGRPFMVM
jgi:hypothetical protein